MKILILNFEYPPLGGGGGVATQQVAETLADRHEVHVLTTHYRGLKLHETMKGVRVHRVRAIGRRSLPTASFISLITFVPAALWRGWQLCRRERFDVINAQFVVPSGIPAALLAKVFHVPLVVSFIGGDVYDPSKGTSPHRYALLRSLVRSVAGQAVIRTAISSDTKERAQELHGVGGEIVVTHLGIPPKVSQNESAGGRNPKSFPYFVTIGRLIPRKRCDILLKAWRNVNAQLIIIGSGPMEAELKKFISDNHMGDKVKVVGFVSEDQKQKFLHGAIGYVSAAEHEGFGIVFLEAMQAGLPIVATDIGGQTDFLEAGENALFVRPHDAAGLQAAVNTLLADQGLREKMARNNRERVKDFYLEKTVGKFERVLEDAVKRYANHH